LPFFILALPALLHSRACIPSCNDTRDSASRRPLSRELPNPPAAGTGYEVKGMVRDQPVSQPGAGRILLRELGRLLLESVVAGTFVSLVLALAVFIVASQAQAATPAADVQHGTLLLRDDAGAKAAAPLLFTDVHIDISGLAARAKVTQRFVNPTAEWREGVYVFPLPERAAVDHLDMRIGTRVIEGRIKEKQAARAAYEQAKTEGRKATLVEQERPNLFTTSVAHIGPNEEIAVSIEYQEKLQYDAGSFRLRFPMAITPRYIPAAAMAMSDAPDDKAGVIDADRVTPPVAHPADGAINPISLSLDIDAGFPLARLSSTYHSVHVEERPGNRYHVTLSDGVVPAARDFELVYTPDVGAEPGAAFFTQVVDGRTYGLLMVLPPTTRDMAASRPNREITYIIDTSGSMEGVSIAQAREAMLIALDRLQAGDRFNVIEFNSVTQSLFTAPMPVDAATLDAARAFVRGLRARGGTQMKPALEAAFAPARADALMRQIVFMTDGAVGNENELLQLIARRLGDRRLFTVGIGPAPNTYFMKKAAEAGRGTFTFIGDVREVKEKMTGLIRKLESPVLTDVRVEWPAAVEAYPAQLPDLYAGEPAILTAAFAKGPVDGGVRLSGHTMDKAWRSSLPLVSSLSQPGIGVLYARDKIEALADARRNGAAEDDIRHATIAIALAHHLVSAYTSLVAVDVTPTAPAGITAHKTALPGNLPEGLVYESFFGGVPQTATPAALELLLGTLLLASAALGHAMLNRRRRRVLRDEPSALRALHAAVRATRRTC
jgi:Ca-activated chloride channel homolog